MNGDQKILQWTIIGVGATLLAAILALGGAIGYTHSDLSAEIASLRSD